MVNKTNVLTSETLWVEWFVCKVEYTFLPQHYYLVAWYESMGNEQRYWPFSDSGKLRLCSKPLLKPQLAGFGPRFSAGHKSLNVSPEEALRRHDQVLKVKCDWPWHALTRLLFGLTVETRLLRTGVIQNPVKWNMKNKEVGVYSWFFINDAQEHKGYRNSSNSLDFMDVVRTVIRKQLKVVNNIWHIPWTGCRMETETQISFCF